MPILEVQSRMYERGRIRIGQKGAKGNPVKLDRFRFTSAARENLLPIAAAYGGQVVEWLPADGRQQYEVITDSTRVPILLPANPVTQWLELWSGGGCQRRCDGVTEVLSDTACLCGPDPEQRACKPTTRLNVVLRDMPGIGVWRLESHGWNAATELPGLAAFVAQANGMVPAFLTLEERVTKSDGQTRRFMVPGIDIDITPAQLMAGTSAAPAVIDGGPVAAIEGRPDYISEAKAATTTDDVSKVWRRAGEAGHLDDALKAALQDIAAALPAPVEPPLPDDVDTLWQMIVAAAPSSMTMDELEQDFAASSNGVFPGSASVAELQAYVRLQKTAAVTS